MSSDSPSAETSRLSSLRFAVLSDVGRKREENQDSFGVVEGDALKVFMVADGMGGARGGAVASGLAIDLLKSALRGQGRLDPQEVCSVIVGANKVIAQKGALEPALGGMGTTLVGIAFAEDKTLIFNVGDSRLYRLRKSRLELCTEDHTLVQELLKSGAIGPEQAKNHPVSHMLTRSLGPTVDLQPDCWEVSDGPFSEERFLLCSDGLYNQVAAEELEQHLRNYSLEECAKKLVDLANERGGPDNITVLVLELGMGFPAAPEVPADAEPAPSAYKKIASEVRVEESNAEGAPEDPSQFYSQAGDGFPQHESRLRAPLISATSPVTLAAAFLSLLVVVLLGRLDEYEQNSKGLQVIAELGGSSSQSISQSSAAASEMPTEIPVQPASSSESASSSSVSAEVSAQLSASSTAVGALLEEVPRTSSSLSEASSEPFVLQSSSFSSQSEVASSDSFSSQTAEQFASIASQSAQTSDPSSASIATSVASASANLSSDSIQDTTSVAGSTGASSELAVEVDPHSVILSGEQALMERQLNLKTDIERIHTQLQFLSGSSEERSARLQILNEEKLSIQNAILEAKSSQEQTRKQLAEARKFVTSVDDAEPLALATQLSNRFPRVLELHKAFENATTEYLRAVQEKRAAVDNTQATQNVEQRLQERTAAFEALRAGMMQEAQEVVVDLESKIEKTGIEQARLQSSLVENDKQRFILSDLGTLNDQNEIDAKREQIQHSLSELEQQLRVLTGAGAQ